MENHHHSSLKNTFLFWGLIIYIISFTAMNLGDHDPDRIQIPSFALVLLFLVQIIFPNFRFSKLPNCTAVFIILGSPILLSLLLLQ